MKKLKITLFFISMGLICQGQVKVLNVLTENRTNPLGIDATQPRFSWQLSAPKGNATQSAYEIRVTAAQKSGVFWTSGKVTSGQSVQVPYSGSSLESGQKYSGQVRVWDQSGKVSPWSEPFFWQMGLLKPADWKAKWITAPGEDTIRKASPLFRKKFNLAKKVASATAFITSHGLYEASINGKRIGDAYLTPGWTSYKKRLQYQQYDITSLLTTGDNAVGVVLGNGWYRGFIGFGGQRNFYGKDLSLLLQIQIHYTDGTSAIVVSDESWKSSTGSIFGAEIYDGEMIDARKE
ncbi:MAG TPA: alpha-L-rhamnosidase N-terminal domain-containing protein, partial [Cyclobacteriaceae bacterium]|nr:alpha-L-rhamnosidase N-terminal domain-containing protein [Cyclobacteriaceae bacterium]